MTSMMTIDIPYPASDAGRKAWAKRFSLNAYWSGKPWQARKRDAEYWHQQTVAALICTKHVEVFRAPVKITFLWHDNLDIDNHAMIGKMIVDTLKKRVITDDNKRQFVRVTHGYHDADCIRVIIEEAGDG